MGKLEWELAFTHFAPPVAGMGLWSNERFGIAYMMPLFLVPFFGTGVFVIFLIQRTYTYACYTFGLEL